jgi:hypothetical protein
VDFFGLVRVTITWLPSKRAAADRAETVEASPVETDPPGTAPPAPDGAGDRPVPGNLAADTPVRDPAPGRDVIQSLIGLADDVTELAGQATGSGPAADTLRLVQWRVDQALADVGVRAVSDAGPVDPARHVVAGTRPAGPDSEAGLIAATVRRGYLQGGELIRPQQVIAYTGGLTDGTERGSNDAGED